MRARPLSTSLFSSYHRFFSVRPNTTLTETFTMVELKNHTKYSIHHVLNTLDQVNELKDTDEQAFNYLLCLVLDTRKPNSELQAMDKLIEIGLVKTDDTEENAINNEQGPYVLKIVKDIISSSAKEAITQYFNQLDLEETWYIKPHAQIAKESFSKESDLPSPLKETDSIRMRVSPFTRKF